MRRKTPRAAWLLLLAVLAFVAAGCGGGDDSSSSSDDTGDEETSDALSEDDFLEQFDDACLDIKGDLDAIDAPTTNSELADAAGEAIDIVEPGLEELRGITPPEDLQSDVDDLLGTIENQLGFYEDLQTAAEDENDDDITSVGDDLSDTSTDLDDLGEEIGLECFVDDDSSDDFSDSSDDFSDSSDDFSDDFSDDLSDDFSDSGSSVAPQDVIAEYGSDAALDSLADACFVGDFQSCDDLFAQSASGSGYESYGDSCGGLQAENTGQFCTDVFG